MAKRNNAISHQTSISVLGHTVNINVWVVFRRITKDFAHGKFTIFTIKSKGKMCFDRWGCLCGKIDIQIFGCHDK